MENYPASDHCQVCYFYTGLSGQRLMHTQLLLSCSMLPPPPFRPQTDKQHQGKRHKEARHECGFVVFAR